MDMDDEIMYPYVDVHMNYVRLMAKMATTPSQAATMLQVCVCW